MAKVDMKEILDLVFNQENYICDILSIEVASCSMARSIANSVWKYGKKKRTELSSRSIPFHTPKICISGNILHFTWINTYDELWKKVK